MTEYEWKKDTNLSDKFLVEDYYAPSKGGMEMQTYPTHVMLYLTRWDTAIALDKENVQKLIQTLDEWVKTH